MEVIRINKESNIHDLSSDPTKTSPKKTSSDDSDENTCGGHNGADDQELEYPHERDD